MAGLVRLFLQAYVNRPADPKASFEGKTVIVTGSNVGLGYEAVRKFVALGAARFIIAVRNCQEGALRKKEIGEEIGSTKEDVIDVWHLDMISYDSIKSFARRVSDELERLDIVVLNAGVHMVKYEESKYGWEQTLQVNTLSTVLLGLLLLPKLKASKHSEFTPVLEIVSSGLHQRVKVTDEQISAPSILESYNVSDGYKAHPQYGVSKMLVEFAVLQLAALAISPEGKIDVVVTSVCPGACKSNLARGYTSIAFRVALFILQNIFLRSTETGARTLVSGTTLGEKSHGKFWQHDEIKQ